MRAESGEELRHTAKLMFPLRDGQPRTTTPYVTYSPGFGERIVQFCATA